MGRGDRKSRKGKIFRGSYGVSRPRKTETVIINPTKKKEVKKEEPTTKKKATTKKKPSVKKKVTKESTAKKK